MGICMGSEAPVDDCIEAWKEVAALQKKLTRRCKPSQKKELLVQMEALVAKHDRTVTELKSQFNAEHPKACNLLVAFRQMDINMNGSLDDWELQRAFDAINYTSKTGKQGIKELTKGKTTEVDLHQWMHFTGPCSVFDVLTQYLGGDGKLPIPDIQSEIRQLGDKIRKMEVGYDTFEVQKKVVYEEMKQTRERERVVFDEKIRKMKIEFEAVMAEKRRIFDEAEDKRKQQIEKEFSDPLGQYDKTQDKSREVFEKQMSTARDNFAKQIEKLTETQQQGWDEQQEAFNAKLDEQRQEYNNYKLERENSLQKRTDAICKKFQVELNPIEAKQKEIQAKRKKTARYAKELERRKKIRAGKIDDSSWKPAASETLDKYT